MIPAVSPCTRQVPPAEITTKMHDATSWGGGGGRLTTCPENVNSHGIGQQIHKVCIDLISDPGDISLSLRRSQLNVARCGVPEAVKRSEGRGCAGAHNGSRSRVEASNGKS